MCIINSKYLTGQFKSYYTLISDAQFLLIIEMFHIPPDILQLYKNILIEVVSCDMGMHLAIKVGMGRVGRASARLERALEHQVPSRYPRYIYRDNEQRGYIHFDDGKVTFSGVR